MTLRANARLAGLALLFYFATGIAGIVLLGQAAAGTDATAQLASIARHTTLARATALVLLLEFLYAVVIGVTLYALTRDQDRDLARLGMACHFTEGAVVAVAAGKRLDLIAVAIASAAPGPDAAAARALGASLMRGGGGISDLCFAAGSLIFASLFLRARSIPAWLSRLGVLASILCLLGFPLQMLGFLHGPATVAMWIPLAVFQVLLALWLLIKGVTTGPVPAAYAAPSGSLAT